jgi:hypothetical protein
LKSVAAGAFCQGGDLAKAAVHFGFAHFAFGREDFFAASRVDGFWLSASVAGYLFVWVAGAFCGGWRHLVSSTGAAHFVRCGLATLAGFLRASAVSTLAPFPFVLDCWVAPACCPPGVAQVTLAASAVVACGRATVVGVLAGFAKSFA